MIRIKPDGKATLVGVADISQEWLLYYLFTALEVSPKKMDKFDAHYAYAARRWNPDALVSGLIETARSGAKKGDKNSKEYYTYQKQLAARWKRFRNRYSNKTKVEILDAIAFFRTGRE